MRKVLTVFVLAVVAMFCASANATLATYSWSQANSYTDWTQSFTLPQFNSGLGTLNSVTLTLNGALDQTLKYENMDGANRTAQFYFGTDKTGCDYSLSFTGGSQLLSAAIDNAPQYTNIPAYDGIFDYGGTSGATHEFLLNKSANNVYTDGAMSPFVGTGSVAFDAAANARWTAYGTGGNMQLAGTTLAGAGVTIAYDYTPIPEPATMCLLGLGALGLLKRRKA